MANCFVELWNHESDDFIIDYRLKTTRIFIILLFGALLEFFGMRKASKTNITILLKSSQ